MIQGKILFKALLLPFLLITGLTECQEEKTELADPEKWRTITVTASAYNSLAGQGYSNPQVTAWGDTLKPGMQSIAVSRDLLLNGLTYGTPVRIEGLEGTFIVNDKMHFRWKNKIDIYMGKDVQKALKWGKRKVEITYKVEPQE